MWPTYCTLQWLQFFLSMKCRVLCGSFYCARRHWQWAIVKFRVKLNSNAPTFHWKSKQKQISPLKRAAATSKTDKQAGRQAPTACITCGDNTDSINWNRIERITEFRVCPIQIYTEYKSHHPFCPCQNKDMTNTHTHAHTMNNASNPLDVEWKLSKKIVLIRSRKMLWDDSEVHVEYAWIGHHSNKCVHSPWTIANKIAKFSIYLDRFRALYS